MTQATRTQKKASVAALAAAATCIAALLLALPSFLRGHATTPATDALGSGADAVLRGDPLSGDGSTLPAQTAGRVGRHAAPAESPTDIADRAPTGAEPLPSFEEVYRALVDLYADAGTSGQAPNEALFHLEVRRLFGNMLERPDARASLIAKLTLLPGDSKALRDLCAFRVCRQGLEALLQQTVRGPDPDATEHLAGELLATLPYSAKHAEDAASVLAAGPYMSPPHETLLLHLSQEAEGDLAFMAGPVIRLLLHLWESNGIAADAKIETLLTLADGADPAARAAWVRLFEDEQSRAIVLDRVMALDDMQAIDGVAILAAVHLEPGTSVHLLEEISRRGHRSHASGTAYFHVADKGLTELKDSYTQTQSDEALVEHRGNIVNAIGIGRGDAGNAFVIDVFESDPSPAVRALAVQTLGANGGADFKSAFESALADSSLHGPRESDILASALQNYVGSDQVDGRFVRSAADRLLRVGSLSRNLRTVLEEYGAR